MSKLWIGGQRTAEGNFRWAGISTNIIDLGPWGDVEPNNYKGNQHCVSLASEDGLRFDDRGCSTKYSFVCEL